ncbi:hypothetical protein V8E36_007579 [Tilletia maclaganii]
MRPALTWACHLPDDKHSLPRRSRFAVLSSAASARCSSRTTASPSSGLIWEAARHRRPRFFTLRNIQILFRDAQEISLPGLAVSPTLTHKVELFTYSYSISLIPPFYAILDDFLDIGVFGVVGFYISAASTPKDNAPAFGGHTNRHSTLPVETTSSPQVQVCHVQFLYHGRHNFVVPFISVYICTSRSHQGDTSAAVSAFQVEAGDLDVCPPLLSEISCAYMLQDGKETDSGTSSSHSVRGAHSTARRRRGSDGVWYDPGSDKASVSTSSRPSPPAHPTTSKASSIFPQHLPFVDN